MRRSVVASLSAALVLAVTGCGDDEVVPFAGTVLDNPYDVPSTPLVDTDGQPFSLADDTDKPLTMVFFGYVNCVDVCPAVLTNLASALTRLDDSDREKVDVVLVTSDPVNDTPESLRTYLDQFDTSFIGLDGEFDTVADIGRAVAVGIDRADPGGHTTQVLAVDPGDESPVYWGQDTSPSQYADDIHTLLKDS